MGGRAGARYDHAGEPALQRAVATGQDAPSRRPHVGQRATVSARRARWREANRVTEGFASLHEPSLASQPPDGDHFKTIIIYFVIFFIAFGKNAI